MSFETATETLGKLVLFVLALSTVVATLEVAGFLPRPLAQWLARNRAANTIAVLRQMGWDPKGVRDAIEISRIRQLIPFRPDPEEVGLLMREADLRTPVRIGGTQVVQTPTFVDVMGRSADPKFAMRTARVLAARWRELTYENEVDPAIDAIVGIKSGSPLIAYELSRLLDKPLVLHTGTTKFASDELQLQRNFDTTLEQFTGRRLLLVDDSTTGGTKAMSAITDIRSFGGTIDTMLVLFVPSAKDPATLLSRMGVRLHSATSTDR